MKACLKNYENNVPFVYIAEYNIFFCPRKSAGKDRYSIFEKTNTVCNSVYLS